MRSQKRWMLLTAWALAIAAAVSLAAGRYPLKLGDLLAGDAYALQVFRTLRLPRTLIAVLGGFSLGCAGFAYQTVFRNPLSSPDIIGVTSGASVGAAVAILFVSAAPLPVMATAFAGAVMAVALSLGLARLAPGRGSLSVVLAGVAVQAVAQSALMVMKLMADPEKQLASIEYWLMGSLSGMSLSRLPVFAVCGTICPLMLWALHRQMLVLSMDEAEARSMGVSPWLMRAAVLGVGTMATAAVVSVTGPISFIGLLAPHIARLMNRNNRPATLLLSGLVGALLLCAADIAARSVAAAELPVSIFTSALGAPFLIFMLAGGKER